MSVSETTLFASAPDHALQSREESCGHLSTTIQEKELHANPRGNTIEANVASFRRKLLHYASRSVVYQRRGVVVRQLECSGSCNFQASLRGPDRMWCHGHNDNLDPVSVLLNSDSLACGDIQQEDEIRNSSENL
jgi:hypothetical protein